MRHKRTKALLACSIASLVAPALVVAPAVAVPAPTSSAKITANAPNCTVTGTYQWRSVAGATSASVTVYDYDSGVPVGSAWPGVVRDTGRVFLTVSGTSGRSYYAVGSVTVGGTLGGESSSLPVTLTCR